jgi:hypothetical protein
MVQEVALVVSALAAGVGVGAGNVASTAVMDAYQTLKNLVIGRFTAVGRDIQSGEKLLAEAGTTEGRAALAVALDQAEVDEPTTQAAHELLDLLEKDRKGKFIVDTSQAKGVYIGDGGTQNNHFTE